MYRNIMFDLDGTVTDSGRAIVSAVEYALSRFGYENQPKEKLESFIGPSLFDSFTREYAMNEEDCKKAVALYREVYEKKGLMFEVDIYEGIPELLTELKNRGFRLFLVTSKPLHFTGQIMERIGLAKYFEALIGPELTDPDSDKKRLIERAVSEYGLLKEECLMIGDTKYDILGACDAGVDSIGVLYGYGSEEELKKSGATYLVDSAARIPLVAGLF